MNQDQHPAQSSPGEMTALNEPQGPKSRWRRLLDWFAKGAEKQAVQGGGCVR